jgi:dTDP-4-dehydrorhamnose 3,5-epimerase
MTFVQTHLNGVFTIEPEKFSDDRGFFSYSFDRGQFAKQGLPVEIVQSNVSFNLKKGTLRGMHFQVEPAAQPKLVRCTAGAVFDVIIDLRRDSQTYCQPFSIDLSGANLRSLFIPAGLAHGFQTLTDGAEVLYEMFAPYEPEAARGVRYDDPRFGIRWPLEVAVISERDRTYADYQD